MYNKYSKGQPESAREITIKTGSGTNVRGDIMTRDGNGGLSCIECKSLSTAPLTQNQKIGSPDLEKNGGIIVEAGKPGFEGDTKIPPTQVIIIRPESKRE